ncbi:MAG: DNA mismatch repair protein MutS [Candidatus Dojkabacteria bacterium]
MTPMQEQFKKIKSENPGTVILFRLGDFYETFDEDAETVSRVLGITLTSRGKDENRQPLAGIPYHALPNYMPRLVEAGLKIAIAEQMEAAVPGKLVERSITKIITPGTIIDENSLDSSKNNYIASVVMSGQSSVISYGLVFCDLTTGELKSFTTNSEITLKNELKKINPSEIICPASQYEDILKIQGNRLQKLDDKLFDLKDSVIILEKQFKVSSLKGFGLNVNQKSTIKDSKPEDIAIVTSAGALICYLIDCQKGDIKHIRGIQSYSFNDYMKLDFETIRNLELLFTNSGHDSPTLYSIINRATNPMGKRKLRNWILNPLVNVVMIKERHDSVEFFFNKPQLISELRDKFYRIADIERIVGRIGVGGANPKDLVGLKNSLINIINISNQLSSEELPTRLSFLMRELQNEKIKEVIDFIDKSIDNEPSALINNGGILKSGYHAEVDELRNLRSNSKQILAEIQKREIERTKITSLKISFNNVFGYYIEITRTHLDKVPEDYIRKQTLANAERYITQELKELEVKILSAEEKLIKLEQELFIEIRNKLADYSQMLLAVGNAIAEVDVIVNFGFIAREFNYTKPSVVSSQKSENLKTDNSTLITDGRHPVVERLVEKFIPNSTEFSEDSLIHILTGPNMSGKSTYIRQVALITLMAQIGSYVPAKEMKFQIVDRIFTRVGASDNLSKGESTFMVEMTETANILNNATSQSLIILDEVGRGTSTYDGVAIAWSIVEYLQEHIKAKTLFATHYHELISLESQYKCIKNFNVKVVDDKEKEEILFTHKIEAGSANKSYGVHVAKLAGVPVEVTKRANEILNKFENSGIASSPSKTESRNDNKGGPKTPKKIHPEQMGLI